MDTDPEQWLGALLVIESTVAFLSSTLFASLFQLFFVSL
jgi:hypothetical protein